VTPWDVLEAAANVMERTSTTRGACARNEEGVVVPVGSPHACAFCVSGAARLVTGYHDDVAGAPGEAQYLAAMRAFTEYVGTDRVDVWADASSRSTAEVVDVMRAGARHARLSNAASNAEPLFCQRMAARLAAGALREPASPLDVERTTGTLIVHGHIRPVTLRAQRIAHLDWRSFSLYGIHFIGCTFTDCDLRSADLRGVSLVDCTCSDSAFDDADLAGAYIHGSTFLHCSFTGARVAGAEVSRSMFTDCRGWVDGPDSYRNRCETT
jgi:hypothetical protein